MQQALDGGIVGEGEVGAGVGGVGVGEGGGIIPNNKYLNISANILRAPVQDHLGQQGSFTHAMLVSSLHFSAPLHRILQSLGPQLLSPGQSAGSSHRGQELQESNVVLEIHDKTLVTLA